MAGDFVSICRKGLPATETYPVLHTPIPDGPFVVYMDALNVGLGAILTQHTPQGERPIYFLSRMLSLAGKRYEAIKKEVSAMK